MALPPLRTVSRDPAPAPAAPVPAPPAPSKPSAVVPVRGPAVPVIESARLTPEVRGFLTELVQANLLTPASVGELLAKVGDRLPYLTTRDRAADELSAARAALGADVRRLYIAGSADPLEQVLGVTPDLTGSGGCVRRCWASTPG